MTKDEIIIRNAIIHILDSQVGEPVLSGHLLETGPDLNDMIRGLIYKILSSDDMKSCSFQEGATMLQLVRQFTEADMVNVSGQMAQELYQIMNANIDIPAADFLVATYQVESSKWLALLKLNYKETFVHMTGSTQEGICFNDIIKQTSTLPGGNQRLSEAALINLETEEIKVVERKYEVNGEKTNYLSQIYLGCQGDMSPKTKMNIVSRAVDQINKKYFDEELGRKLEAKSIIQNEIEEKGSLDVEVVAEKIYGDIPEVKEEFTEKMDKYNMTEARIEPKSEATTKKFQKQYLKTDTGIEINIPMNQYNENDSVEFITNEDGTISIMIKNINHISSK